MYDPVYRLVMYQPIDLATYIFATPPVARTPRPVQIQHHDEKKSPNPNERGRSHRSANNKQNTHESGRLDRSARNDSNRTRYAQNPARIAIRAHPQNGKRKKKVSQTEA
jgi:hypothetical protein